MNPASVPTPKVHGRGVLPLYPGLGTELLLPGALFEDVGTALNDDGIGGFDCHRDAAVAMLPGTWKQSAVTSLW